MSDEWKQHLSEAHKGQKAWNCGLDMSDKRVHDNIMKRNHTIAEQNKLKYIPREIRYRRRKNQKKHKKSQVKEKEMSKDDNSEEKETNKKDNENETKKALIKID